jgi:hypothetical protein
MKWSAMRVKTSEAENEGKSRTSDCEDLLDHNGITYAGSTSCICKRLTANHISGVRRRSGILERIAS